MLWMNQLSAHKVVKIRSALPAAGLVLHHVARWFISNELLEISFALIFNLESLSNKSGLDLNFFVNSIKFNTV